MYAIQISRTCTTYITNLTNLERQACRAKLGSKPSFVMQRPHLYVYGKFTVDTMVLNIMAMKIFFATRVAALIVVHHDVLVVHLDRSFRFVPLPFVPSHGPVVHVRCRARNPLTCDGMVEQEVRRLLFMVVIMNIVFFCIDISVRREQVIVLGRSGDAVAGIFRDRRVPGVVGSCAVLVSTHQEVVATDVFGVSCFRSGSIFPMVLHHRPGAPACGMGRGFQVLPRSSPKLMLLLRINIPVIFTSSTRRWPKMHVAMFIRQHLLIFRAMMLKMVQRGGHVAIVKMIMLTTAAFSTSVMILMKTGTAGTPFRVVIPISR